MLFLSIFGCKIIFCALSIFGVSKIPARCLKEALVMWPLSASRLSNKYPLTSIISSVHLHTKYFFFSCPPDCPPCWGRVSFASTGSGACHCIFQPGRGYWRRGPGNLSAFHCLQCIPHSIRYPVNNLCDLLCLAHWTWVFKLFCISIPPDYFFISF